MDKRCCILLVLMLLAGCESTPVSSGHESAKPTIAGDGQSAAAKPLAYVNGRTVTRDDLMPSLTEAAGGAVLSEIVLDQMIDGALADRGLTLTPAMIEQEKADMLATLSVDPDEAARLLKVMRSRRGLGEVRFAAMLRRNAGLRLLTKDDVELAPALLHQAFEVQHGKRYRVRIIVTDTLSEAGKLKDQAEAGASFSDLAAMHSTDPSAAQGGLLSPISPADPTYPAALREAMSGMKAGEVSDVIAADDRFIIMRVEAVLPADGVSYEAALPALARQVRLELEAQQMQQAARAMLADAKVVVLDPALGEAWRNQQQRTHGE